MPPTPFRVSLVMTAVHFSIDPCSRVDRKMDPRREKRRGNNLKGGIHFTQVTPTSCGRLPGSPCGRRIRTADEAPVGRPGRGRGLLHESVEEQPTRGGCSSVEAEGVLVEVIVEVPVADRTLVGSEEPSLEQGGDAMHPRQRRGKRASALRAVASVCVKPSTARRKRTRSSFLPAARCRLRRLGITRPSRRSAVRARSRAPDRSSPPGRSASRSAPRPGSLPDRVHWPAAAALRGAPRPAPRAPFA